MTTSYANFNFMQKLGTTVKRVLPKPGQAMSNLKSIQGTPNIVDTLNTIKEANQHSKLGNTLNAVGLAGIPLGLAPLVMKDANTKALEQMRNEDKLREAKGLAPLATNTRLMDMAKQGVSAVGDTLQQKRPVTQPSFSTSKGGTRIVDLTPEHIVRI